ncbi:hypothetical protein HK096_010903, partial [Nowakowskiella sp. JEL0078]
MSSSSEESFESFSNFNLESNEQIIDVAKNYANQDPKNISSSTNLPNSEQEASSSALNTTPEMFPQNDYRVVIPNSYNEESAPLLQNNVYFSLEESTSPLKQIAKRDEISTKTQKPKRTTVTNRKLTLFPQTVPQTNEEVSEDFKNSLPHLPHVIAKAPSAFWLNKLDRKYLPRVTAYCTAGKYKLNELHTFLQARRESNCTAPREIGEVIYTPFTFDALPPTHPVFRHLQSQHNSEKAVRQRGKPTKAIPIRNNNTSPLVEFADNEFAENFDQGLEAFDSPRLDTVCDALGGTFEAGEVAVEAIAKRIAPIGDCLFFEYGVVVMWGLSIGEERMIL